MNINERFKLIRKNAKLSQKEFGERIGLGQAGVSWLEQSGNNITDLKIRQVCSLFGINENWLRTGEGKMKSESDEAMLDRIARELSLTPLQSEAFHYLMSLPDEERETVAKAFFILLKGNKKPAGRKESCPPETEADVKRKIVNAELDAEAKGKTS